MVKVKMNRLFINILMLEFVVFLLNGCGCEKIEKEICKRSFPSARTEKVESASKTDEQVAPEKKEKLPEGILGFKLGQSLEEVDRNAESRRLTNFNAGYADPTKHFYFLYGHSVFHSVEVKTADGKVSMIIGKYLDSVGTYKGISEEAKKKFGKPYSVIEEEPFKSEWYWETVWVENSVVVKIYAFSYMNMFYKTKQFRKTEIIIYDRREWERIIEWQEREKRRIKKEQKKEMFGGD